MNLLIISMPLNWIWFFFPFFLRGVDKISAIYLYFIYSGWYKKLIWWDRSKEDYKIIFSVFLHSKLTNPLSSSSSTKKRGRWEILLGVRYALIWVFFSDGACQLRTHTHTHTYIYWWVGKNIIYREIMFFSICFSRLIVRLWWIERRRLEYLEHLQS
jgi:hypothetical protein